MSSIGRFPGRFRSGAVAAAVALVRLSVARPGRVLAAAGLAVAVAGAFVPRIDLQLDGRSLIPRDHPSQEASDAAARTFGVRDLVVVGVSHPGGIFQPAVLDRVARLSSRLGDLEGIAAGSVASLATLPRFAIDDGLIDPRPVLDAARPTTAAQAADLARETRRLGLDDGVLVSADHTTTSIVAQVQPEADRAALLTALRRVVAEDPEAPGVVRLSGTALAQASLGWAVGRDLARLMPAVVAGLLVVLLVVFRHPAPALAALLEVGVSLTVTAGVLGLTGGALFVTTLVLPVILLVIGVSDDVYALATVFQGLRRRPGAPLHAVVVEAFEAVAGPVLLTAVTTSAGLLSLAFTPLVPQRTFGIFGALAILLSTLMTFTLVPAVLMLGLPRLGRLPAPRAAEEAGGSLRLLDGLLRIGPRRILAAAAVVTALALATLADIRIEDSWLRNLPERGEIARDTRWLDGATAGTLRLELAVDSGRREGLLDPEVFARLGELEDALRRQPGVGGVTGFHSEVLRVRASLEGVPWEQYRRRHQAGGSTLSAAEIDHALLLLGSLRRSPLEVRADEPLRRARVVVYLRGASYARIDRLLASLEPWRQVFAGLVPFGDAWISHQTVELLVVGQVRSVTLALVADFLLLLLIFRSWRSALVAVVPTAVSIAGVFGFLATTGIPLSIASSMFAAIALGIGVDYAIHLVVHVDRHLGRGEPLPVALRRGFAETAPAIAKSAVAVSAGLALLMLSGIRPNAELGLLVCLSQVLCATATLVLVPALLLAFRPSSRITMSRRHEKTKRYA